MQKKVTTIPATLNLHENRGTGIQKKRVAAYARVSTCHEEQQKSYEAQVDYYTNYIKCRADWDFVKVYTDEGITGTNTKLREGFKIMVLDALAGKIDLIVTKSVSRFARNTVDSLTTIRKLKEKNIECYFEKENIWTFDGKGELLITIMSSLAQEESRSISENTTWGRRKQFADGKASMNYSAFLGYDRGQDGGIVVNEEQAKTVKLIYRLFVEGLTPHTISQELTKRKLTTPTGRSKWNEVTVKSILTNEKYKGDALLQKSYTIDFLTKKTKINNGEVPQYYVENNHEAIISRGVFESVQLEIEKRKAVVYRYSGTNIFTAKVRCGECGCPYVSQLWHSTDKYRKIVYRCNHKYINNVKCKTPHLSESEIKEMFIQAMNKILVDKKEIIANLQLSQKALFGTAKLEAEHRKLLTELKDMVEKIKSCVSNNARKAQEQSEYEKRYKGLVLEYEKVKLKYEGLGISIAKNNSKREVTSGFIKTISEQEGLITEFDSSLWGGLLENMTVYTKKDIRFKFKDGTEITL